MSTITSPPRLAALTTGLTALALAALLGGCGGGSEPAASVVEADATIPISTETATDTSEDTVDPTPSTDPVTPASTIEAAAPVTDPAPDTTAAPRPYAAMALTPTESGSNPLLSWDAVDGAALYRLVVLDPDGEPYWAWSGTATSVHVGGNAAETSVGARIYAEMSWQVSAYDDAGVPIAFSDIGLLSP